MPIVPFSVIGRADSKNSRFGEISGNEILHHPHSKWNLENTININNIEASTE
jgi:hypothetical protein